MSIQIDFKQHKSDIMLSLALAFILTAIVQMCMRRERMENDIQQIEQSIQRKDSILEYIDSIQYD